MSDQNAEEDQYLQLIRNILKDGGHRADRTGTGTVSLFTPDPLRFRLTSDTGARILPLLTTKRVFLRGVIEELLWFVNGSTDAKLLQEKDVHIWDGNGSREFLDGLGLNHREEGDLGPVYGFQWRHFGAPYKTCHDDYSGQGVDQLAEVIYKIKHKPSDRRIVLSAWNPKDLPLMALPPCHMFCQFYVHLNESGPNGLSCTMYQRSADVGLGLPFNIASYALLTHMIAYATGTTPHTLTMVLGDAHVYKDHIDPLQEQLARAPRPFPSLSFAREYADIGAIDAFAFTDFVVDGYKPHGKISMKMSA